MWQRLLSNAKGFDEGPGQSMNLACVASFFIWCFAASDQDPQSVTSSFWLSCFVFPTSDRLEWLQLS